MLVMPVAIVSSSIAQVYFGELSDLCRQKSQGILSFYKKTTRRLFRFGAPVILLGAFVSPVLFPIVFGSNWKDAGMFSLPLSFSVIASFVISPTHALALYGYNHWDLAWNIGRLVSVIAGFLLAFYLGLSAIVSVLIYSLIMTFMYIICYILNVKAIGQFQQKCSIDEYMGVKEG
jgi:O-antigen/teichoic acid export membrane protein